jgi:hypothetical protein
MKLTEIYNEFLVESIENLPEILAKGIEATSIDEMEDTLLVFGGAERIETSLPLFAYTLLKKGKTESFEKLLDSLWQWEDPFPTVILLIKGLSDYYGAVFEEYNFKTVIVPELQDMWSDLIVVGDKYYLDVLATDMADFFAPDRWNGVDCKGIANDVFTEGIFENWEDHQPNPSIESLIMEGYVSDETYIKIIKYMGEHHENDIISNSREEFETYKEEDQIPDHDKDSFYLTRNRIDRYLNLEGSTKYDFVILLGESNDGLDELKDTIVWTYNDTYNWTAQNSLIKDYENELYTVLGKPEQINIKTYNFNKSGREVVDVDGYRFDVTNFLETFVMDDYFSNEYTDQGGLLECLISYEFAGLGGLCPDSNGDWVDDTSDEFIESYNVALQEQL